MEGIIHILETIGIQDIQQALGQMHLGTGLIEASNAMMVAPQSPDRASMFSMCFPEEFTDYDLLMDLGDVTDGATLYDACIDDMDMIGKFRSSWIMPYVIRELTREGVA